MKQKKQKKPKRKPTKRKGAKPRTVRGTASGVSRKRPSAKKTSKKTYKKKISKKKKQRSPPKRRIGGRAEGVVGAVRAVKQKYNDAKDVLGELYDETLKDTYLERKAQEAKATLGEFYDDYKHHLTPAKILGALAAGYVAKAVLAPNENQQKAWAEFKREREEQKKKEEIARLLSGAGYLPRFTSWH